MSIMQKILIVDTSKVIRASLTKSLQKNFEVREDDSAELAWQSLVLDNSITAVVSGLDITSAEGSTLVERLRASKLQRLNRMPYFQLASENFPETKKEYARNLGVTDFVPKASASKATGLLLQKLNNV